MDNGLIQLLVVAVFVIISMMDGAARRRRKQAQRLGLLPQPDESFDADEADEADEAGDADDDPRRAIASSEGLVPADLWEEIAALARGETPVEQPAPPQAPASVGVAMEAYAGQDDLAPTEAPSGDLQGGYLHPDQAATHQELSHVARSARAIPEEQPHEFAPHRAGPPSGQKKAPRRARRPGSLLEGVRQGAKESLRDAIVLAEVLSPPIALRDSERRPPA